MRHERVSFYYDGFNLYHALNEMGIAKYKWLNLAKLSRLLLSPTQKLGSIKFFSAAPTHYQGTPKSNRLYRWKAYRDALMAKSVEVIEGRFAGRTLRYKSGDLKLTWQKHEEKETDVRLATSVLCDAMNDDFDVAAIISVDTDMIPVFEALQSCFPEKRTVTVAPPRRSHAQSLIAVAHFHAVIKRHQLEKSLFGRQVVSAGKVVAKRPLDYRP